MPYYSGGLGTQDNPYLIQNLNDLIKITSGTQENIIYYKMINDIYNPPGIPMDDINLNYQNFDGNGYTIFNLLKDQSYSGIGLFNGINYSTLKNLNIDNPTINGTEYSGGFARQLDNFSIIENCHIRNGIVRNDITGTPDGAGGIVGNLIDGTIRKCSNIDTRIYGQKYMGGIQGTIRNGLIEDCYVDQMVTSTYTAYNVGGIVGDMRNGIVRNTFFEGSSTHNRGNIGFKYSGNQSNNYNINISTTSYQTSLTLEEQKVQQNFNNFDFVNIWNIQENVSSPKLKEFVYSEKIHLSIDTNNQDGYIKLNGSIIDNLPFDYDLDKSSNIELEGVGSGDTNFKEWEENSSIISTEPIYTFVLLNNRDITANFINGYRIDFVDWDGTILHTDYATTGTQQTQPQNPVREGYTFTGWDKDFSNITENITVNALYTPITYNLTGRTFFENVNGKVWDTVGSISGLGTYDYNSEVTIEQQPEEGMHFVKWYYYNEYNNFWTFQNQNPYTFTIENDLEVFAKYETNQYLITYNTEGNGVITNSNEYIYHANSLGFVEQIPDPGWKFSIWKVNGIETGTLPSSVTDDLDIIQVFEKEIYDLTININGNGSTDIISGQYEYGDIIEINQTPDNHWYFENWTGDITSNSNPLSITIENDMTINQNFKINKYNFTFEINGNGHINIQEGLYDALTDLNIIQTPDINSQFKNYTGQINSTNENINLTMDSDKHLIINFEPKKFNITYEIRGNGTAEIIPNQQQFEYGSNQEIKITPQSGWKIVKIEEI